ncbi:uncharacterized protein UBRO_20254 [Ustilago bromivora]|uniref:Uncharacterized protein n=1 Tax=Ustilago bromivora TaxID=307758 RepID=A0A1K0FZ01_9BASI|nr:uncharacterized protein UBRO_20254 [Ustilago bromivora]
MALTVTDFVVVNAAKELIDRSPSPTLRISSSFYDSPLPSSSKPFQSRYCTASDSANSSKSSCEPVQETRPNQSTGQARLSGWEMLDDGLQLHSSSMRLEQIISLRSAFEARCMLSSFSPVLAS